MINEKEIRKYLAPCNYKFIISETSVSTNETAKMLALDSESNVVVISDSQTGGKGRMGRSFHSPKGCGIYMSILRRQWNVKLLTVKAAVAVSRAIEKIYPTDVKIKWVNDLFINGRKICGILCESGFTGDSADYAVAGIGINVHTTEFPPEISDIATSIERECGIRASRNRLIAEILNEIDNDTDIINEYRRRSNVLGKRIRVISAEEEFFAFAEEIDDSGALLVKTEDGIKKIYAGEVSIRI